MCAFERSKPKSRIWSQGTEWQRLLLLRSLASPKSLRVKGDGMALSVKGDGMAPAWTEYFNVLRNIKRLSNSHKIRRCIDPLTISLARSPENRFSVEAMF